jgi:uncharacterized membrane protein
LYICVSLQAAKRKKGLKMKSATVLCVLAGFFWAAAPLIGRLSSANAMMTAVLVACGTFVAALPFAFSQNYAAAGSRTLLFGLAGGIANGVGVLFFYRLVAGASQGLWEASKVLPVALVLVPVGTAVGSWIFYSEPVTVSKIIGVVLAGCAIWFLK